MKAIRKLWLSAEPRMSDFLSYHNIGFSYQGDTAFPSGHRALFSQNSFYLLGLNLGELLKRIDPSASELKFDEEFTFEPRSASENSG